MNYDNGTRYGKAGFFLIFLLACAALAFWAPDAGAQSGYYTSRGCSSCHGTSPTTCNGCHEHGVNGLTGSRQSATVNKTTFAPGENVIVTLRGGRTSSATNGVGGWVRGILYRDNVEIARSTGTGSPPRGGSGLPIAFTTPAPTAPGTYTYAAAWFGNTQNTGSTHGEVRAAPLTITVAAASVAGPMTVTSGNLTSSGVAGGPFTPSSTSYTVTNTGTAPMAWTATKTQSWVTLSSTGSTLAAGATATVTASIGTGANSLAAGNYSDTVTFTNSTNGTGNATRSVGLTVTAATATLTSIAINGLSSLNEGATATYTATATWSDTTTSSVTPTWSVSPTTYANVSGAGLLTTLAVTANQSVTLTASYTAGSATRTATKTVSILDVGGTLDSIAISGAASVNEGATATYTATATWSDGTHTTVTPVWTTSLGSISASGVLTAPSVAADQSATIGASYTSGNVNRTASVSVTIVDVPPQTGTVDVMPQASATDVPVNTVITATESGPTDIRVIFNSDTFTLQPNVPAAATASAPSWPYRSSTCTSGGVVQGVITYNTALTEATFTPNCPLANGTTYVASIAIGTGSPLTAPESWTFTTIASSPDSDEDGSPDNEDDSPNDGRRCSRWSSKGTGKIHVDSRRTAGTHIRGTVGISDTSTSLNQAGKPAGYEFRDGMIAFQEVGVASGDSAEVTVTFPSPIPPGSKVYQAGADGFHEVPSAVIDGNTVRMTVFGGSSRLQAPADNLAPDSGVLVDPVGVAAPVSSGSGSIDLTSGSAGGGCSVVGGTGSGGSNIDAFLILAGLGLISWRSRMQHRRK